MGIIRKYAFVSVLVLAVIYVYVPLKLQDVAKFRWLDDINVILNKPLASAKPEAGVSLVDPIAAANVDEDLDYRIAQQMKSTERWSYPALMDGLGLRQAFLGDHVSFRIRWAKDSLGPSGGVRDCRSLR